jgi:2'-5' RNA ligase
MPKSGDLIIVNLIDNDTYSSEPFERKRETWPLHMTLTRWFDASRLSKPELFNELDQVAQSTAPFDVEVGGLAMFGPDQDVPVNTIVNPGPVKELHMCLLGALRHMGVSFENEQYFGENYRPHITRSKDKASEAGAIHRIGKFSVFRLVANNYCELAQEFELKGATA